MVMNLIQLYDTTVPFPENIMLTRYHRPFQVAFRVWSRHSRLSEAPFLSRFGTSSQINAKYHALLVQLTRTSHDERTRGDGRVIWPSLTQYPCVGLSKTNVIAETPLTGLRSIL